MASSSDSPGIREPCYHPACRMLVVADQLESLRPLVDLLLGRGLSVRCWDCSNEGPPRTLPSPVEIVVAFGDVARQVSCGQLRQDNPDVFFACLHDAPPSAPDEPRLETGFDAVFSLQTSHDHLGDGLVAAARFVQRVRHTTPPHGHSGSLTLDDVTRTALLNGRQLELTSYEYALLSTLAQNLGRVLSRQDLLELAKGSAEEAFDRSIDVQISRLRAKLGDNPRQPTLLKTVRGKGYVLVPGTLKS